MSSDANILFVSQDPGGFNAILPVFTMLCGAPGFNASLLLGGVSRSLADEESIPYINGEMRDEDLRRFFLGGAFRLVVCGTSRGYSIDQKICLLAKEMGVAVVYVMDYWSLYGERFYSEAGLFDTEYMPDAICVIDELMYEEMVRDGFDSSILHITGNPYFETFKHEKVTEKEHIFFASQPFSEQENTVGIEKLLNEVSIFSDYVKVLEENEVRLPVYIGLHPRCRKKNKFDEVIQGSSLEIKVLDGNTEEMMRTATYVIGIKTMVLFHAAMLGKMVFSYEPGISQEEDTLMSNHIGLSHAAYTFTDMKSGLMQMISGDRGSSDIEEMRQHYVYSNATQKVVGVIERLLPTF